MPDSKSIGLGSQRIERIAVREPSLGVAWAGTPTALDNLSAEADLHRFGTKSLLFVTNTRGFGGTEKHLIELIRRLSGCGVRASILCAGTDPYTERLARNHLAHIGVRRETGLESIQHWRGVFRELQPDVLVFVHGTLFDFPWYAAIAGRLAGIRRLYAIQHATPPPAPARVEGRSTRSVLRRMIGWRTRRLLKSRIQPYLCRRTICVSHAVRNSLIRDYGFPPSKILTIHNGVSASEFSPSQTDGLVLRKKLGIPVEEFLLVCVARLSEEKGVDVLLRAMSQVLQSGLACKCIIVGDGYLRSELSQQARGLDLSGHVFFAGFQEDVLPYLQAGNAFVLTSRQEALGLSILEAMACGLPCIVTRVGGIPEVVEHGVQGIVVNPDSGEEVAKAISYLLREPRECERMSRMARARACELFDIESRMTEIKHVILD